MRDNRNLLGVFAIITVGLLLPITVFIVNQGNPQDIRQQAASPTPIVEEIPKGCPSQNDDGSVNTCRPTQYCLKNEVVKYEGNEECTNKLNRNSFCCTRTP